MLTDLPSDRATIAEPILAWRAWTLSGRGDGSELRLRPIGASRPWAPLEATRAVCKRARIHRAPAFECTCGMYATRTPDLLRRAKDPAVVGTVALWGRVVEHERGYRGEHAYPQRLRLVCFACFWQWGLSGSRPDLVTRMARGRMVPLCLKHVETGSRYGFPIRSILPAAEIEQNLLSTYAVDLLPT